MMKPSHHVALADIQYAAGIVITVLLGATGCAAKPATPVDNWVLAETEHVRLRAELPVAAAQDLATEMQEIRDACWRSAFALDSAT